MNKMTKMAMLKKSRDYTRRYDDMRQNSRQQPINIYHTYQQPSYPQPRDAYYDPPYGVYYDPYRHGGMIPHDAFMDRSGNRHYDNGRFAPKNEYTEFTGEKVPMGFQNDSGRYDGRRYGMPRNEYGGEEYIAQGKFKIGQAGGMEKQHKKLTREEAEHWVNQMDKPDGSGKGGKWTYENTTQILKQKGYDDVDPVDFYVAMNMLYSDYGKTLAKHGINNVDVYADLALNWIEDEDIESGKMKTSDYYYYIVK